jgi:hypothetical protein
MFSSRRVAAVGAAALIGAAALAGCSSSSSSDTSSSAAPASSAAASAASPSSTAGMLPPVIITEGQTTATAKVGDFLDIVVTTVAGTTVDTDKPELLEVTQAHEDNGAVFNPGAKALAAGTAILTVTNPDNTTRDITVTITQ